MRFLSVLANGFSRRLKNVVWYINPRRLSMLRFFQGKNKKAITGVLIAIIVLALVVPICLSMFGY